MSKGPDPDRPDLNKTMTFRVRTWTQSSEDPFCDLHLHPLLHGIPGPGVGLHTPIDLTPITIPSRHPRGISSGPGWWGDRSPFGSESLDSYITT